MINHVKSEQREVFIDRKVIIKINKNGEGIKREIKVKYKSILVSILLKIIHIYAKIS